MVNGYQRIVPYGEKSCSLTCHGVLTKVDIPYVILQGDTDIVASTATVKRTGAK